MKQVALEGFLKKDGGISRTMLTAKMELFKSLVSRFHPLSNITKSHNIGAMRVLNGHLDYYNVF